MYSKTISINKCEQKLKCYTFAHWMFGNTPDISHPGKEERGFYGAY